MREGDIEGEREMDMEDEGGRHGGRERERDMEGEGGRHGGGEGDEGIGRGRKGREKTIQERERKGGCVREREGVITMS